VALLLVHSEVVDAPAELPTQICSDPDEDKFLSRALASGAAVVVSGDRALLAVTRWNGIEVVKPRTFLERYLPDTT
jgi:predicted nucleic acid-binding protein